MSRITKSKWLSSSLPEKARRRSYSKVYTMRPKECPGGGAASLLPQREGDRLMSHRRRCELLTSRKWRAGRGRRISREIQNKFAKQRVENEGQGMRTHNENETLFADTRTDALKVLHAAAHTAIPTPSLRNYRHSKANTGSRLPLWPES